ncbi:VWA domain-containing protein [candidate division KSB1 bacterium]
MLIKNISLVTCFLILFTGFAYTQKPTAILFVFDASGSMAEEINGESKFNHAKRFIDLFLSSGINADFGLTVFGSEESSGNNAYFSPVPVGRETHDAIRFELDQISPAGRSPIASALLDGSFTFNDDTDNYILLVTDGDENAGGGPVTVTSDLRNRGIINRLFITGFLEDPGENRLISELIAAGNGSYHSVWNASGLIAEIQNLISTEVTEETKGLLGYRSYIKQEFGFPAYGTSVELRDESGNVLTKRLFWRGIFEGLDPGTYSLVASIAEETKTINAEVTAGDLAEVNFIFNIQTGGFSFEHLIQGTTDGKAYGTITKVYHETGETVFTGTTWSGLVENLPKGDYEIEGEIEGQLQEQTVAVTQSEHPNVRFYYDVGKGRLQYRCFLDSALTRVANGTAISVLRMPYNELALSLSQWRGTTPFLPIGSYLIEGNYQGIIRREQIDIKPDSTSNLDFVFNVSQVRFTFRCFRNESNAPATGVLVEIFNNQGMLVERSTDQWRGSYVLPEGIYTLQALYQGQVIKRTVNLIADATANQQEDIYFNR